MKNQRFEKLSIEIIRNQVKKALEEDIGSGDITSLMIPSSQHANAILLARQKAVVCGQDWLDEAFNILDHKISVEWLVADGESVRENQIWCKIQGPAQPILTGERTALNFIQFLSGTATTAHMMANKISDLSTTLLDTRKTIPNLRSAQKYAVMCGGGSNHRNGLYDGVLIKENHIRAAGSLTNAIHKVINTGININLVQTEVENLNELEEALKAGIKRVLLDNFSIEALKHAVSTTKGRAKLEASGNVNLNNVRDIALTGVDFISSGYITKDLRSIDLSLQFEF